MTATTGPQEHTIDPTDREPGSVGPPPSGERSEIRWHHVGGIAVVVKAAAGPGRDRLRREGEVLRRLGGADVVDIVELTEGPDHTELVTQRFGEVTLNDAGLLSPEELGMAMVATCAAVANLHATGWAHGAIRPSHVLVEPGRGVRLCSLGAALQVSGGSGESPDLRADDAAALSSLVVAVLSEEPGFSSFVQRWRWRRAARTAERRLRLRRGLASPTGVAAVLVDSGLPGTRSDWTSTTLPGRGTDHGVIVARVRRVRRVGSALHPRARADGPTQQASQRSDPEAERRVAPRHEAQRELELRRERQSSRRVGLRRARASHREGRMGHVRPGRRFSLRAVAAAAASVAVTAAVLAVVGADETVQGPATTLERPFASTPQQVDVDAGADSDGRNVLTVGGTRYRVGRPGDIAVAHDWNCDGRTTAALLRPSSGEVFVFDDWATTTATAVGTRVDTIAGAVDLVVGDEPCAGPAVVLRDGSATAVGDAADPRPGGGA